MHHHACFMLCCAGIQGFEHARQVLYTPAIPLPPSQLSGLLSKLSFGKQASTKANRGKLQIGPKQRTAHLLPIISLQWSPAPAKSVPFFHPLLMFAIILKANPRQHAESPVSTSVQAAFFLLVQQETVLTCKTPCMDPKGVRGFREPGF